MQKKEIYHKILKMFVGDDSCGRTWACQPFAIDNRTYSTNTASLCCIDIAMDGYDFASEIVQSDCLRILDKFKSDFSGMISLAEIKRVCAECQCAVKEHGRYATVLVKIKDIYFDYKQIKLISKAFSALKVKEISLQMQTDAKLPKATFVAGDASILVASWNYQYSQYRNDIIVEMELNNNL